jgi:hypothetical protein
MSEMFEYSEDLEVITLDEWYKRYKPISDPTREEFFNSDIHKIWTLIESDDGGTYVIATGPRRANSFHTFITKIGWKLWDEVEVPVTNDDDEYYGSIRDV